MLNKGKIKLERSIEQKIIKKKNSLQLQNKSLCTLFIKCFKLKWDLKKY